MTLEEFFLPSILLRPAARYFARQLKPMP
jgi:hypothetical protein